MTQLGLNKMNKQELRAKLAEDADKWLREHGEIPKHAAPTEGPERFRLFGHSDKRKPLQVRDPKQEAYEEWLESEKQRLQA